jgi:NADPH:quinone reductase-like Zn-dependent oxidoreductase
VQKLKEPHLCEVVLYILIVTSHTMTGLASAWVFSVANDAQVLKQVPLPEVIGLDECLVQLTASTICGSDLHTVQGRRYNFSRIRFTSVTLLVQVNALMPLRRSCWDTKGWAGFASWVQRSRTASQWATASRLVLQRRVVPVLTVRRLGTCHINASALSSTAMPVSTSARQCTPVTD